ncbi:MAG: NADH-ubiquinone oxidoreductase-F iron-sulfur binding region domain-containing protein [Peptoniphilaceae bacterium]
MNYELLDKIKSENYPLFIERIKSNPKYIIDDKGVRLAGEFYEKQLRVALKNFDIIDPNSIYEYISNGGYYGLAKAIFDLERKDIIQIMKDANLRGRGGAGFPAGFKWETAFKQDIREKYVICNADEGDPGAYMDRSILEGDPHSVIEGMAICARAIGASKGYVYVRAEYPNAVKMLRKAIKDAKKLNMLGENILGSDFSFDLEIRLGAGAFVCGEGTAMIQSIEGNRGMPQAKVYRTTVRGLFEKPTVVNNVETLANVAQIINNGADWFKSIGTEDSPGTKVFALVGKVKNAGLVEVPMGKTINEIVFDIGGGIPNNKNVKAVQTGGPSGGCIPPHLFDTKVDYGSLEKIGSIMGSGGMVVMDEDDCMVDIAKFFMDFTVDESCGKCTPCRIGNKRVLEILERITNGHGRPEDIDLLEELCWVITDTSLCGLGKTATNPVISSLHYFKDEYLEHINNENCPAKVCIGLMAYYITDACIGCGLCKRECPVEAIDGSKKKRHKINIETCIKCGNCMTRCPVQAIVLE